MKEYWETKSYWAKEALKTLTLMILVGLFVWVLLCACTPKNIQSINYYNHQRHCFDKAGQPKGVK